MDNITAAVTSSKLTSLIKSATSTQQTQSQHIISSVSKGTSVCQLNILSRVSI